MTMSESCIRILAPLHKSTRPLNLARSQAGVALSCQVAMGIVPSCFQRKASLDIASDVEGLESAKQNLQIVQKRRYGPCMVNGSHSFNL